MSGVTPSREDDRVYRLSTLSSSPAGAAPMRTRRFWRRGAGQAGGRESVGSVNPARIASSVTRTPTAGRLEAALAWSERALMLLAVLGCAYLAGHSFAVAEPVPIVVGLGLAACGVGIGVLAWRRT